MENILFLQFFKIRPVYLKGLGILCPLNSDIMVETAEGLVKVPKNDYYIFENERLYFLHSDGLTDCIFVYLDEESLVGSMGYIPDVESSEVPKTGFLGKELRAVLSYWILLKYYSEKYYDLTKEKLVQFIPRLFEESSVIREGTLPYSEPIRKVIAEMMRSDDTDLRLERSAEIAGLGSGYFGTKFRNETGFQYVTCVNQIKLYRAVRGLGDKRYSMREISDLAGFSNQKVMNRIFTQYLEMTPSEVRKETAVVGTVEEQIRVYYDDFLAQANIFQTELLESDKNSAVIMDADSMKYPVLPMNYRFFHPKLIQERASILDYVNELDSSTMQNILIQVNCSPDGYLMMVGAKPMAMETIHSIVEEVQYRVLINISLVLEFRFDVDNKQRPRKEQLWQEEVVHRFMDDFFSVHGTMHFKSLHVEVDFSERMDRRRSDLSCEEMCRMYRDIFVRCLAGRKFQFGIHIGHLLERTEIGIQRVVQLLDAEQLDFLVFDWNLEGDRSIRYAGQRWEYIMQRVQEDMEKVRKIKEELRCDLIVRWLRIDFDLDELPKPFRELFENSVALTMFLNMQPEIRQVMRSIFVSPDGKEGIGGYIYDSVGFKKPFHFSLDFMNRFRGEIVYKDANSLLCKDGDNYCGFILSDLVGGLRQVMLEGDTGKNIAMKGLRLKNLDGMYQFRKYQIDLRNGCPSYYRDFFKDFKYLNLEEKQYIENKNLPRLSIRYFDLDHEDILENFYLQTFEAAFFYWVKLN